MPIHVIVNIHARGLASHPEKLDALDELCRGRAILHRTRDVSELPSVMEEIARRGCRLLVLAGGDGTFMSGATAIVDASHEKPLPAIGLLPMGTVGTTARNFSERGDPEILLGRWLSAFSREDRPHEIRLVDRATLKIHATRGVGEPSEDRIGFTLGTGLVARFFEVYESGGARGIPLAGKIVARIFAESIVGGPLAKRVLTPMRCELWIEGERHDVRGLSLLCASVVQDLGLGMKVNYRAGERSDRVHLVASSLEPRHLGPRMPYVMMGRSIGGKDHVDRLVERFEVRFPDEKGPYVVDGDMFHAKSVEVRPGPVLSMIGPPR